MDTPPTATGPHTLIPELSASQSQTTTTRVSAKFFREDGEKIEKIRDDLDAYVAPHCKHVCDLYGIHHDHVTTRDTSNSRQLSKAQIRKLLKTKFGLIEKIASKPRGHAYYRYVKHADFSNETQGEKIAHVIAGLFKEQTVDELLVDHIENLLPGLPGPTVRRWGIEGAGNLLREGSAAIKTVEKNPPSIMVDYNLLIGKLKRIIATLRNRPTEEDIFHEIMLNPDHPGLDIVAASSTEMIRKVTARTRYERLRFADFVNEAETLISEERLACNGTPGRRVAL
jgi:hypothetical protein